MSGYTAAVLAVAAVAGAGVSAYSSIESGKQQKKMYDAQAQAASNDAAYKKDASRAQAEKIRKMGAMQKGEAKAALAGSGVDVNSGTPLELQKSITRNSEEDALSAILGGKRASDVALDEASMLTTAGANAQRSGNLSAAGTMLSAASGWVSVAKPKKTAA